MRTWKLASIGAAVVLGFGTLAGCGSASSDTESDADAAVASSAQPTPEPIRTVAGRALVDQGNGLCRAANRAVGAGFAKAGSPPKPAALTAAFENALKESYKLEVGLLVHGAPAGKAAELVKVVQAFHKVTTGVEERGQDAFFATDEDPWAAIVATLVEQFGLTECSSE